MTTGTSQHVQKIAGIPSELIPLLNRVAERCVDGVVIVDAEFCIQLISSEAVALAENKDPDAADSSYLYGSNYFETFFHTEDGALTIEEMQRIPMYKAITTGEVNEGPLSTPTIVTPEGSLAQVKTYLDRVPLGVQTVLQGFEFWRPHGIDPEAFEYDDDFMDFRRKEKTV